MKKLNIAMVGYGFMGRTHSNAYRKVNNFFDLEYEPVLKMICGLEEKEAKAFAKQWGYESYTTDWHKVIEDDEVDLVDICVPNNVHAEIAIAAAKAGKAIICEKPLALDGPQAQTMVDAVEKAGVANFVSYKLPPSTRRNAGKEAHRRGTTGTDIPLSRQLPAGLDYLSGRSAGRYGDLEAGRQGSRFRSNG